MKKYARFITIENAVLFKINRKIRYKRKRRKKSN
jgi:hypothetical protein